MTQIKIAAAAPIKDVAVIGSGVGGLVALKALLSEGFFAKVQLYERQPVNGGIWNFGEKIGGPWPAPSLDPAIEVDTRYTPLYKHLETNVPYYDMEYNDTPFDDGTIDRRPLFASHVEVARYLHNYGKKLEKHVENGVAVTDVRKIGNKWHIKLSSDFTGEHREEIFDAVVLSTGNYNTPYIPFWQGLEEWNRELPNSVTHSKDYRTADAFKGKTVIVVGSESSGNDIATAAKFVAKKVYQSIHDPEKLKKLREEGDKDINYVANVLTFHAPSRTVTDISGAELHDVDSVVFATGYLRSYPYLRDINNGSFPVITDGLRLHNTYAHLYYAPDPTLIFMAVPKYIQPFRTAEVQAIHVARYLSGRLDLPSLEERLLWDKTLSKRITNDKAFHNMRYPDDFTYCDKLIYEIKSGHPSPSQMVPTDFNDERRRNRFNLAEIRKAFLQYRADTGKAAHTADELSEAGYFTWDENY
jgi:cation diffusion facilitator CzcD-associated flavoprotein CzcO